MPDGTNVDWSSVRSGDIHLRAISQVIDQPSVTEISLKITHFILIPQGPMSSGTKHLDVASSHSHSVFWQKRKKKNECVMVGIRAIMHIFDDVWCYSPNILTVCNKVGTCQVWREYAMYLRRQSCRKAFCKINNNGYSIKILIFRTNITIKG